jgi:hypothetical protein
MTFNPLMAKVTHRNLKHLPTTPTVVELGNQRFTVTEEILDQIIQAKNEAGHQINLQKIQEFKGMNNEEKLDKTGEFFKSLGFQEYNAIDLNSKFESMVMDLNTDIKSKYDFNRTFDLVTNNGTGEHLFNQFQVFKNMHDITKKNGLMIHVLPFVNWLNHGFFNFHPILFFDLAATNNYEIIEMSFGTRDGTEVKVEVDKNNKNYNHKDNLNMSEGGEQKTRLRDMLPQPLKQSLYKNYSKIMNRVERDSINKISVPDAVINIKSKDSRNKLNIAIDRLFQKQMNINIIVVLRKTNTDEFVTPIQGKYSGDNLETEELKNRYETK